MGVVQCIVEDLFPLHRQRRSRQQGNCLKLKIILIAQWLSCCMLWMMGYDYNHVIEEINNLLGFDNSDSDDSSTNTDISGYDIENNSDDSDYECASL